MFETKSKEQKLAGKTIALLDVDDTLIVGNPQHIDYSKNTVEDLIKISESHLEAQGILNQALLNALKNNGVTDVYLFTDMVLGLKGVIERIALVNVLKKQGFNVLGVATPADCAWHIEKSELENLVSQQPPTLKNLKPEDISDIEKYENHNKRVNEFSCSPGKAFSEAKALLPSGKILEFKESVKDAQIVIQDKAINAKLLTDFVSILNGIKSVKGIMFQLMKHFYKNNMNSFIVCDDKKDVLESITQVQGDSPAKTVYVNNNQISKEQKEQIKDQKAYNKEISVFVSEQQQISKVYNKLLSITEEYLKKSKINLSKKPIFQTLKETLEDKGENQTSMASKIQNFTQKLSQYDNNESLITQHSTETWKRYVLNVMSILTVLPAFALACRSYAQYGTVQFWKPDSEKAFISAKEQAQKVLKLSQ